MKILNSGYTAEINKIEKSDWMSLLNHFDDTTIFQFWDYGNEFLGRAELTHFVLKKNGKIVAIAQGRIIHIPGLRIGVANFLCAPVWRLSGTEKKYDVLRNTLRALRNEYADNRGFLLRIRHYSIDGATSDSIVQSVFAEEGYELSSKPYYRTILLNISQPLSDIRSKFLARWRRNLVKAEKKKLKVTIGIGKDLFNVFKQFHDEMSARKQLTTFNPDLDKYWNIQEKLSNHQKMVTLVCEFEGEPVSAILLSAAGKTGFYLFGATSDKGMRKKLNASYLLHWRAIEWLKAQGYTIYDLRGYNPEAYPGVSRFKDGFSGEYVSFNEFQVSSNMISYMVVVYGEKVIYNLNKHMHKIYNIPILRPFQRITSNIFSS